MIVSGERVAPQVGRFSLNTPIFSVLKVKQLAQGAAPGRLAAEDQENVYPRSPTNES
jgi:hypothetical protein